MMDTKRDIVYEIFTEITQSNVDTQFIFVTFNEWDDSRENIKLTITKLGEFDFDDGSEDPFADWIDPNENDYFVMKWVDGVLHFSAAFDLEGYIVEGYYEGDEYFDKNDHYNWNIDWKIHPIIHLLNEFTAEELQMARLKNHLSGNNRSLNDETSVNQQCC